MDFRQLLHMAQSSEDKGEIQESWDIYMQMLSSKNLSEHHGEGYFELAMFLLRNQCYDEALSMFVKAFSFNYKPEDILEKIDDIYYNSNILKLKNSYEKNTNVLSLRYPRLPIISFEQLPLKFIPISTQKFYIFDVDDNAFVKQFSLESNNSVRSFNEVFMFKNEYDFNSIRIYSQLAEEKKILLYFIYDEVEVFLSYLQVIDCREILINPYVHVIFTLADFIHQIDHDKKNIPTKIVNDDQIDKYVEFIQDIQGNRYNSDLLKDMASSVPLSVTAIEGLKSPWLKKQNEIILSFCIPTYNRGHRALENVKHILELSHQREIEVVICDNNSSDADGTYRELSLLNDTRVKYYKNKENMGFCGNFMKVIQLARGKYVYIISDEDFVNLSSIPKLLDMMKREENIGIIRGSIQPKDKEMKPADSCISENNYLFEQGLDAFSKYAYKNNYISGTIYNRDYILEGELFKKVIDNLAEHDAYPHLYLEALLCTKGNVKLLSGVICFEGPSESVVSDLSKGVYSYENRLKQHRAFVHILNEVFERLNCNDTIKKADIYLEICEKIFRLIRIFNGPYYIKDGQDMNVILKNTYYHCLKTMSESFDNTNLMVLIEGQIKKIYNKYI